MTRTNDGMFKMQSIESAEWSEKSDIWSAACILIELYSGQLLFNAHHDDEHLAMIEKVAGQFPIKMRHAINIDSARIDHVKEKVNQQKLLDVF